MGNPHTPSERHQTNSSLLTERQKTDDELGKTSNCVEERADVVVARARARADETLRAARLKEEAKLQSANASPAVRAASKSEQSTENSVLHSERQLADAQLAEEREIRHSAVAERIQKERTQTDNHLALERARGDQGLQEILSQLQEAARSRDEFLSLVAHELRTPLTPMALRLQALEREAGKFPDSPSAKRINAYVQEANGRLRKLVTLIADLLDVSDIASGRLSLDVRPVDFGAVVRSSVQRLQQQRVSELIAISVDAPSIEVQCDALRLEQLVVSLLDNAVKFGCRKPINVVLRAVDGKARLTVEDAGIGIAPEHQLRIFSRFERAVSPKHYGGLGLGLYVCRNICEALGGKIGVRSAPNEGSTFTVELPMSCSVSPL